MESKFIEIRDRGTFIPALAVRISRADGYLAGRAGFGDPCVLFVHLTSERCAFDPYHWEGSSRTMHIAHKWIETHWSECLDGAVVDVQFILGETACPKLSEQESAGKYGGMGK